MKLWKGFNCNKCSQLFGCKALKYGINWVTIGYNTERNYVPVLYNMWLLANLKRSCVLLISHCSNLSLSLPSQICGFVNAISPVGNDQQNLMAFRFSAFNPILDPWIFIIFRKAVFNHIREFFHCCFPRDAVKTTAQNSLSFPMESGDVKHSSSIQSKIYCSLPQWGLDERQRIYDGVHWDISWPWDFKAWEVFLNVCTRTKY